MNNFKCERCRAIFITRLKECPYCGGHIVLEDFCRPYRYTI